MDFNTLNKAKAIEKDMEKYFQLINSAERATTDRVLIGVGYDIGPHRQSAMCEIDLSTWKQMLDPIYRQMAKAKNELLEL